MGGEHQCEWREKAEALEALLSRATEALSQATEALSASRVEVATLRGTVEKLQRHVFGKRSEKMPPVDEALRRGGDCQTDPALTQQKRRENAEQKKALVTREIHHRVREEQKICPKCGGHDFSPFSEIPRG